MKEAPFIAPTAHDRSTAEGVCEVDLIDVRKVRSVSSRLMDEPRAAAVADLFAAMADRTRVRLLHALCFEELCVCDLAALVSRSMGTASRHLQMLRRLGFVTFRVKGKLVYYSLASAWVRSLVLEATERMAARGPEAHR